jgi:5-methylcytosine-specific restriction endonuclease McrA
MGQRSKKERDRDHDRRRASEQPWRAWYKTREWEEIRQAAFLRDLYTCQMCGRVVGVHKKRELTCDHIRPHRGDRDLFFDLSNVQTLDKACHDGAKQRQEARGYLQGCDENGRPIDPAHPWNARR